MKATERLYEIVELDDYGRAFNTLGTVYASSPEKAEEIASDFFNNPEIRKTGFYKARLPEATIKLSEKDEYWGKKIRYAEYILSKAGKL